MEPISSEAFSSNSGSVRPKKAYIVKRNNDRNGVHEFHYVFFLLTYLYLTLPYPTTHNPPTLLTPNRNTQLTPKFLD